MRIGVDVFSLDKPGENYGVGVGVYTWKILPELVSQAREHHFVVFANRDNKNFIPKGDNVQVVVSPLSNKYRFLRVLHEQIYLPFQFVRAKLNFMHSFGINTSILLSRKSILTIYDLMWKYYFDRGNRGPKFIYYRFLVPSSIKYVQVIITISRFVAGEVGSQFNRSRDVYPVHLGPGEYTKPATDETATFALKYCYPYIYTVTTSMPHKNLIVLLDAFLLLKRKGLFDGKLVITGQLKGNFHENTNKFIHEHRLENDIFLTGFVSSQEKTYCYQNAEMFVFPSLYEGFGLPLLEAMTLGVPVVAANAASLPEIGEHACVYFDPHSADDLCKKIMCVMNDREKRKDMIRRGLEQSGKFSWEKTAKETLSIYEKTFGLSDS
jgi:glycosyltransferase involved in cell wall biosynthesis